MLVRALPTLCENIARSLAGKEISFCDMLHNVLYVVLAEYSGNIPERYTWFNVVSIMYNFNVYWFWMGFCKLRFVFFFKCCVYVYYWIDDSLGTVVFFKVAMELRNKSCCIQRTLNVDVKMYFSLSWNMDKCSHWSVLIN